MWLLIDDTRDLSCEVIARTSQAAKLVLPAYLWEGVCLDHDLGSMSDQDGYQLLVWMLESFYGEYGYEVPRIVLVSSNPPGRDRQRAALLRYGYEQGLGFDFRLNEGEVKRDGR